MDTIKVRIEYTDDYAKANYTEERGHKFSEVMTIPLLQCTDAQREAIDGLPLTGGDDPWGVTLRNYCIGETSSGFEDVIYGDPIIFKREPSIQEILNLLVELHTQYWIYRRRLGQHLVGTPMADLTPVATPPTPTPTSIEIEVDLLEAIVKRLSSTDVVMAEQLQAIIDEAIS